MYIEGNGVWSSSLLHGGPPSVLSQPHLPTKSQLPAPQKDRLSQVSGTEGFLLASFLVIVFPVQRSYGIYISNLQARLLFPPSTVHHAFSYSRLFRSIVIPLLSPAMRGDPAFQCCSSVSSCGSISPHTDPP